MKKLITGIYLGLAISVAGAAMANAQQIKVGVAAEPYPPFASPDASGVWQGWEIDFANAVCKEAKLDCVITPVGWDGIIPALTTKKIDMIVGSMSITAERQKTIDFSDMYYNTPVVIMGAKDVQINPAKPETLADKTLGIQVATVSQAYGVKHYAPLGTTIKEYQTQDEANNDLVAGRIDGTLGDVIAMDVFLKTDAGKACCEIKGEVPADDEVLGLGVAIGLRKEDGELKSSLNAAIKAIRENGAYAEFTKKYFDFDIWGPR